MMSYDPPTRPTVRVHLEATGLDRLTLEDTQAQYQVTMARHWLSLTETAMRDEEVPPEVIDRVLRLLIYGMAPDPADIERRQRAMAATIMNHGSQAVPVVPPLAV